MSIEKNGHKKFNFDQKIDFDEAYQHKTKIQEIRELALLRGGECLSDKYLTVEHNMKWRCGKCLSKIYKK